MPRAPLRSPRAADNERGARRLRIAAAVVGIVALAGLWWGKNLLWELRERRRAEERAVQEATSRISEVLNRPEAPETGPATDDPAPRPETEPRVFRADRAITEIRARHQDGSVQGVWLASQALRAEADAWKTAGAPETETNKLLAAVLDAENWILNTKPSFPELRKARGEARWPEILGEYEDLNTRFLTKVDGAKVTRLIKQFDQRADSNAGWIVRAEYEAEAGPIVRRAVELRKAFDATLKTRAGAAARAAEIRDLAELRNHLPGARFRPFYHLPYVLLVEHDERWEESEEAHRVARILLGLRKTFFELYGAAMGIKPDEQRPVTVVVFTTREAYHHYGTARKMTDVAGTEAHFEPKFERLVLHHDCDLSTLLHEGTHQLLRANIRAPLDTYRQAFWFHEGVAEWFAGARRIEDGPDGLPRYRVGLLLPRDVERGPFLGPLAVIAEVPPANRFTLDQLLGLMVQDRDKLEAGTAAGAKRTRLVYAQGWFLIYFLDHFNVDAKGIVQVGAPGKYRDVWRRYLAREMEGASGKATFLEVLTAAGFNLATLEAELNAYLDFVARKLSAGHVRDQQLLPWSAIGASADSRTAATEADDRLK